MTRPTADEIAKVNSIIARGIASAENSPLRSSEQIWEEFDIVWDRIDFVGWVEV